MSDLITQFKAARRAGVPVIAIRSFDPEALIQSLQAATNGDPVIQQDCIRGYKNRNEAGAKAINTTFTASGQQQDATMNATAAAEVAWHLPPKSLLFMLNAHRYLDKADFTQALWNLRDPFASTARTIVLVGPDFQFPAELQQDVLVLDEPLPTEKELEQIVLGTAKAAKAKLTEEVTVKAVNALRGLAAFPAEQAVAMCVTKKGTEMVLDVDELWQRKRQMVSETEALSIYSGKETFTDIGGCEQVKKFMSGVIKGKEAPRVLVFVDEGEKFFSGAVGEMQDSSGTSQDSLATTLKFMEDKEADGAIFVGPPGAAKSAVAKACGNEAGIPTIILDLGAARGSLVGESERKIRNAYKIIDAVGGGRVYFIMTCNKIAVLPPELKRRFTSGIFYFELPDAYTNYQERTERDAIWRIHITKYGLDFAQVAAVDDAGWTGAEIRNCCRLAYRQQIPLVEAAEYIIPVSKSAAAQVESLRREASGKYLCANRPGTYQFQDGGAAVAVTTRSRMIS
jgi:hypothetical protein